MKTDNQNFHVTFNTKNRILLATVRVNGDKAKIRRTSAEQSMGHHVSFIYDRDIEKCAIYLSKESAAVSAVCNGYLVVKA
jgi:hypothetical protein